MSDLGVALRGWRDRLAAEDADVAGSPRRRAPGLRREELAHLAGISVDYVTRLEQGRAASPSAQVLSALAGALRLSPDERQHLFVLAQQLPPLARMRTELTPTVCRLLEQMPSPVVVYDAIWNRLACNRPFTVLFGAQPPRSANVPSRHADNLVWRYVTGEPGMAIRTAAQREANLRAYISDLRVTAARFPDDPRVVRLLADLRSASQQFVELWERGDVDVLHETQKSLEHPELGRLDLDCAVLTVDGADLRVVVFTAAPGTTAAQSLARVAPAEPR